MHIKGRKTYFPLLFTSIPDLVSFYVQSANLQRFFFLGIPRPSHLCGYFWHGPRCVSQPAEMETSEQEKRGGLILSEDNSFEKRSETG